RGDADGGVGDHRILLYNLPQVCRRWSERKMNGGMRRWIWRGMMTIVVILALASVSISCGRTLTVADMFGAGVQGAYVTYHYEGSTFALVETITYEATPPRIVKTNADGQASIPWGIFVHWPLVQSRAALAVNLIYAPRLHNGLAWV